MGWLTTFAYTYSAAQRTQHKWHDNFSHSSHGKPCHGGLEPSTLRGKVMWASGHRRRVNSMRSDPRTFCFAVICRL